MNIPAFNIKDTSNAALERIVSAIEVELQERKLVEVHSDAVTMGISVSDAEEHLRGPYVTYLESIREISPAAEEILAEWYSEEDYKLAVSREGA